MKYIYSPLLRTHENDKVNMKIAGIFLALLFSQGGAARNGSIEGKERWSSSSELKPVVLALQKVFSFYEQNGDILNLDAYFGLRIAQEENGTARLGSAMYKQVARLLKRASHISVDALTTLQDSSPWYYNLVGYAVSQPWHTVRRHNTVNPNLVTRFTMGQLSNDILQRYESCLARLLGSPLHGGKPCDVTSECWNLMIRPGEVGYMLTHQALYFMLGEQRGCLGKLLTKTTKPKLQLIYDRICSNIYNQLVMIEKNRPTKRVDADLMMEQIVVCGLMGYYGFLTPQRLRAVLKWQRPSGCYGDLASKENLAERESKRTMRRLLVKKDLPDGCESHITGVGTALLSIYLRVLLEKNALLTKNHIRAFDFEH
ncbi:UPF0764 protein C16orf89 homolog isoform X2 [Montipora capricornis]|uniref:UPF0764 protein C16orf89 homolog isoform X2 n=1 Tax=Montipora capricornis TaxID=246305 RepID=UPI0035F20515